MNGPRVSEAARWLTNVRVVSDSNLGPHEIERGNSRAKTVHASPKPEAHLSKWDISVDRRAGQYLYRKVLSMLVDRCDDLSRKGQVRFFLLPNRVKLLDSLPCRRDDEV
jgi:hypothetical protein